MLVHRTMPLSCQHKLPDCTLWGCLLCVLVSKFLLSLEDITQYLWVPTDVHNVSFWCVLIYQQHTMQAAPTLCCWLFLSSLASSYWKFQSLDFIPIHTFDFLSLLTVLPAEAPEYHRMTDLRWCHVEQKNCLADRLEFLIHKIVSYKKKKSGCFQPWNFRIISLAATDNWNKYHLSANDPQIVWTSPPNSRFISDCMFDISTGPCLILSSTRMDLRQGFSWK